MRKLISYFVFFIILLLSGCSSKQAPIKPLEVQNNSKILDKANFGNNNEIVLKTGTIEDLNILGVKDDKNFYFVSNDWQKVYLYNTENKAKTLIGTSTSKNRFIKTIAFSDEWIVWSEDNIDVETDSSIVKDWGTYAKSIKTDEIIEIDKYNKDVHINKAAVYQALDPREVSLYQDKIVYDGYDNISGVTCSVIKLYDLKKRSMQIIESNKEYKDGFFSHPQINGNYIVWSLSKCDSSDFSERGNTFIYDIETNIKRTLTTGDEILWPDIYKNYITARVKPKGQNENSSLVLYNLSDGDIWRSIVSSNDCIYTGNSHIEIGSQSICGDYIVWQDNIRKDMSIYDYINKKFYTLDEGNLGTIMPMGIFKNVAFWTSEFENKSIVKYAILKDR